MPDQAIDEVQAKIAYLERAVAELSDVAFRQHKEIQALEIQVKNIRLRLAAAPGQEMDDDTAGARTAEEERPPHY